jgi:hypothetical protein
MSDPEPVLGFGLAPLKREGDMADPDSFVWLCDLNLCEHCRANYQDWKQKFTEAQEKNKRGNE